MIRLFLILLLFLIYGNLNLISNDIIIFSLINIAFYSIIKQKKINNLDIAVFILSSLVIEVFVGLPILIGIVFLFLPLIYLNNIINNYNFSFFIKSLLIFTLSLVPLLILDQSLVLRLLNMQYFFVILVFIFIYLGFFIYGKE